MWSSGREFHGPNHSDHTELPPQRNVKLRTACDRCHQSKMKCSGTVPCASCGTSGEPCIYSASNKSGRPKGVKNKRTSEQMSDNHRAVKAKSSSTRNMSPVEPSNHHRVRRQQHLSMASDSPTRMDKGLTNYDGMLLDSASDNDFANDVIIPFKPDFPWDLWDSNVEENLREREITENGVATYDMSNICNPFRTSRTQTQQFLLDDRSNYNPSPATASLGDSANISSRPPASAIRIRPTMATNDELLSTAQEIFPPPAFLSSSSNAFTDIRQQTPEQQQNQPQDSTCNCLEQHTSLLHRLKKLERGQNAASTVDVALIGVQQALAPWQNFIHCRVCPLDNDQAVLLLSVVTIRSVLRRLQRLYFGPVSLSSVSSGYLSPDEHQQPQHCLQHPAMGLGKVMLGSYEATGKEQRHIAGLLIVHALGKVRSALLSLKDKLNQSKRSQSLSRGGGGVGSTLWSARNSRGDNSNNDHQNNSTRNSSSSNIEGGGIGASKKGVSFFANSEIDVECIQPLLESLEDTVQEIGSAIRSKEDTASHC